MRQRVPEAAGEPAGAQCLTMRRSAPRIFPPAHLWLLLLGRRLGGAGVARGGGALRGGGRLVLLGTCATWQQRAARVTGSPRLGPRLSSSQLQSRSRACHGYWLAGSPRPMAALAQNDAAFPRSPPAAARWRLPRGAGSSASACSSASSPPSSTMASSAAAVPRPRFAPTYVSAGAKEERM